MSESERMRHQERIDASKSAGERNRDGQYATPYPLAVEIARFLRRWWPEGEPVRLLEPCVGTGEFFSAASAVFPKIERAVGVEKDAPFLAAAAEVWGRQGLRLLHGDFTRLKPPAERFNLIVTNPPYVRHHHLTSEEKTRLQAATVERTGIRLSGLAGLYCHFMLLAGDWLCDGGLSAWLVPGEFLDVNYGVGVKEYLARNVNLLHIHRFRASDVQFSDALVSSTVVVFRKELPARDRVTFSQGGDLSAPGRVVEVDRADLTPRQKWGRLFEAGQNGGHPIGWRFGDFFTIKRGLATGNNNYFILPPARAKELGIPAKFLRPILPPPRNLPGDVIPARDDGAPDLPAAGVLIDCDLPPEGLRGKHPRFWAYIEKGIEAKVHEGYLASRRSPWYSQEDRPPAPFLCTYMGRGRRGNKPFRFLWNQSKATAHNVYLLLYPKGKLKAALADRPELAGEVFAALSRLDTTSFIGGGRVYGGGLFKMEPKELAALPADFLSTLLGLSGPPGRTLFDEMAAL